MKYKSKLQEFACKNCTFETNSKDAFKSHIQETHKKREFSENNLAVKDFLLEGPNYEITMVAI